MFSVGIQPQYNQERRYCCAAIFMFGKIKHSFLSLSDHWIPLFSDQTYISNWRNVSVARVGETHAFLRKPQQQRIVITYNMAWAKRCFYCCAIVTSSWATYVAISHLKSFLGDNLWVFFFCLFSIFSHLKSFLFFFFVNPLGWPLGEGWGFCSVAQWGEGWRSLVQCCVTQPQVAVCSENKTKTW